MLIDFLKALLVGAVQGITEWLPVSSTGHMVLVDELIDLGLSDSFRPMFLTVIQLGSILAVIVLYWRRLLPFGSGKTAVQKRGIWRLWLMVLIGCVPAGIAGILLDDWFDEHLLNSPVIAAALIVYGAAFIIIERVRRGRNVQPRIATVDDIGVRDAIAIGAFQMLAIIPGTSRSGSTILGATLIGVSRVAAAEFSFFMAVPVMLGASGLKVLKYISAAQSAPAAAEWLVLVTGTVVAFVVSLAAIKFLVDFVKRHSFEPFGWYRIALGAVVLAVGLLA